MAAGAKLRTGLASRLQRGNPFNERKSATEVAPYFKTRLRTFAGLFLQRGEQRARLFQSLRAIGGEARDAVEHRPLIQVRLRSDVGFQAAGQPLVVAV